MPAVAKVCVRVAVPKAATGVAAFGLEAFVGTTCAVPKVLPPAENVTMPVGPFPLLPVAMLAVSVTEVVVVTPEAGLAATAALVGAALTVRESVFDVLAL